MKKIITYGSFDLFHEGHYKLLQRAKALGDYLIVGVTTEHYDQSRGKMNVIDSLMERIENVKKTGFADEIIIEDHVGQKIEDIIKYDIDIFTVGSDWTGVFDYLSQYCEVVYLERTKGVSSTMLRAKNFSIIRLGIIGTGRIATRFIPEARYVSGISIDSVYNPHIESAKKFADKFELKSYHNSLDEFWKEIDAVYIASPHQTHYKYIKDALLNRKHVLCEKPLVLSGIEADELFGLSEKQKCVLMEGIKTAYCPGFNQLLGIVRSGVIGEIRDVEACFTKLEDEMSRELNDKDYGGSFTELASYAMLPIVKLLGSGYEKLEFESIFNDKGIDVYTKAYFKYDKALATAKIGLGVKSEGQLIISGTKGYIVAEAPWWKTKSFEVKYEDNNLNEKFFSQYLGDGLRYEINDFVSMINGNCKKLLGLYDGESCFFANIMEKYLNYRKENI